ncbi:flagellar protein FliT [Halomonas denitrificans]|uniref:flagellar protein FliT n=1 Tax=Halomonas denitrificans TaxID=370769 RepID=UPI0021BD221A|nr:flagellar protein FliT [Halomonas denitrificans]
MPPLAEYHSTDTATLLLTRHEALLALTEQMLAMASEHDWDGLVRLETDYVTQVTALQGPLPADGMSDTQRQRLGELLEAILHNDLVLRERLVERRNELGELLNVSRNQQDLHRAYTGGRVVNAGARFRRETP